MESTTSASEVSRTDPTDHAFDMMQGETPPLGATHTVEPAQLPQRFRKLSPSASADARPNWRTRSVPMSWMPLARRNARVSGTWSSFCGMMVMPARSGSPADNTRSIFRMVWRKLPGFLVI